MCLCVCVSVWVFSEEQKISVRHSTCACGSRHSCSASLSLASYLFLSFSFHLIPPVKCCVCSIVFFLWGATIFSTQTKKHTQSHGDISNKSAEERQKEIEWWFSVQPNSHDYAGPTHTSPLTPSTANIYNWLNSKGWTIINVTPHRILIFRQQCLRIVSAPDSNVLRWSSDQRWKGPRPRTLPTFCCPEYTIYLLEISAVTSSGWTEWEMPFWMVSAVRLRAETPLDYSISFLHFHCVRDTVYAVCRYFDCMHIVLLYHYVFLFGAQHRIKYQK